MYRKGKGGGGGIYVRGCLKRKAVGDGREGWKGRGGEAGWIVDCDSWHFLYEGRRGRLLWRPCCTAFSVLIRLEINTISYRILPFN